MSSLVNAVALVTGGSRGIGKATAKILQDTGYKVLAPSSSELDVRSEASIQHYLNTQLGSNPLYGLVCNAGIFYDNPIEKHSIENFSKVLDINLTGSFRSIQASLAHLRAAQGAKVILISSVSAYGDAGAPAYSASKAGLIAMMKSIAPELAHDQITINTINPGWVRTDMAEAILGSEEAQKNHLGASLLKRWIEPEEIGELVKFLLSDQAAAICGESINIDAGLMV